MASVKDIVTSPQEQGTKELNFHVKTLRSSNWLEKVYFFIVLKLAFASLTSAESFDAIRRFHKSLGSRKAPNT